MTTVFTGGPGITFPSDTDQDIYSGTAATLNTDTITNFKIGDIIQITDLTPATLNLDTSGNTITFGNGDFITVENLGPGRLVPRVTSAGIEIRLQEPAQNDFNGDGRSDVLLRNDNGQFTDMLGQANGGFVNNDASAFNQVPTNWHIVGTGDFNGDSLVDVLWRDDSGTVGQWLGKAGGGFTIDANLVNVTTDWTIVDTADFNGDGKADILWRNANGTIGDWLSNGSGGWTVNNASLAGVPTDWHVAGVGDFNGDGKSDILWRNDNGLVGDWLGNANGTFTDNSANSLVAVPTDWHIVGVGDFNGDARTDILWRNDNGQFGDWLGNGNGGFTDNSANSLVGVPTNWQVVAVGDYNGDGIDDVLWRDSNNGQTGDWLGGTNGGFTINASNSLVAIDTHWHIEHSPNAFL
jgi:FG-GAP-like repeat